MENTNPKGSFKKLIVPQSFFTQNKEKIGLIEVNNEQLREFVESCKTSMTLWMVSKTEKQLYKYKNFNKINGVLNILQILFQINEPMHKDSKLDHSLFSNDDLMTNHQVEIEIMRLIKRECDLKGQSSPIKISSKLQIPLKFNFLDYKFLFSVARKIDLLKIESLVMQRIELNKALMSLMDSSNLMNLHNIYMDLKLNRNNILEDTLKQLQYYSSTNQLLKPLKVRFSGEQGVDEGGLTKEFFQLLFQQLLDVNFGMFLIKNKRFVWFNGDSIDCNVNFELIGMLIGLALYNQTILKVDFPLVLYKKLLMFKNNCGSEELTLENIEEIEPEIYLTLRNIQETPITEDLGVSFCINYESWGESVSQELLPDGSNVPVTESNKRLFIEKYVNWILVERIDKQFTAFAKGFFKVSKGKMIDMFNDQELFLAICGSGELDFT